jgi:hypothetical protein
MEENKILFQCLRLTSLGSDYYLFLKKKKQEFIIQCILNPCNKLSANDSQTSWS